MNRFFRTTLAVAIVLGGIAFPVQASLVCYPGPTGFPTNDTFTVQAREPGGAWQNLFVYNIQVDYYSNGASSSMVNFSFSNTIEMKVTLNHGTLNSCEIRPASFGIAPVKSGNTLTFSITQNDTFPRKFVLRVNNNWAPLCLHVIGNPLEVNPPSQSEVTYYYGPGIYSGSQTSALASLKTGDKVYIAGGAVVQGTSLGASGANNIRVGGRGIFQVTSGEDVKMPFTNCSNIVVDGIMLINTMHGWCVRFANCDHITLSNFSLFGWQEWSDGIHFDGTSYSVATGCFIRTSDDIMLNNETCTNNIFKNSVVWGDKAQIFVMGFNATSGGVTKNILYQNIDVLNHREGNGDFRGVIKIWCTNNHTVRDILFNNIRIEPFRDPGYGRVLEIHLQSNYAYPGPGQAVRNIIIRNLSYAGSGEDTSRIFGSTDTSGNHTVDTVTFINYTRKGVLVTNASNGNIKVGDFAYHVTFTGPQTPVTPDGQRSTMVKPACAFPAVRGPVIVVPAGGYSLRIVNCTGRIVRREKGVGPKTCDLSPVGQGRFLVTGTAGGKTVSRDILIVK